MVPAPADQLPELPEFPAAARQAAPVPAKPVQEKVQVRIQLKAQAWEPAAERVEPWVLVVAGPVQEQATVWMVSALVWPERAAAVQLPRPLPTTTQRSRRRRTHIRTDWWCPSAARP